MYISRLKSSVIKLALIAGVGMIMFDKCQSRLEAAISDKPTKQEYLTPIKDLAETCKSEAQRYQENIGVRENGDLYNIVLFDCNNDYAPDAAITYKLKDGIPTAIEWWYDRNKDNKLQGGEIYPTKLEDMI